MTPEQELQRAERARQILEDELFRDAVASLEQGLLIGIAKAPIKDREMREMLSVRYSVLHDLLGQLKSHMETGKLARETLRQRALQKVRQVVGL
jgi:hypothetical protein